MDERLLEHYNTELRHLRGMAAEFASEFPKIAGRLSLDRDGREVCPDPYVERLLEGFAFLAARIHLKMDDEFPRFTQAMLETIYPHYLCPIPSMAIVHFQPQENETSLAEGFVLPKGSKLRGTLGKGERTTCTFQTAHPLRLLPVKVVSAELLTQKLGELNLPARVRAKAAIRIRLQSTLPVPMAEIKLDPVAFFIRGADETPFQIFEQIVGNHSALVVQSATERGKTLGVVEKQFLRRMGLRNEEALLPPSPRTFEGYRLLREYFAFQKRFLFFELMGFGEILAKCQDRDVDLVIPLKEPDLSLEGRIERDCFELNCTPIINLFPKTLDRINLSDQVSEFHVVPDRNRPLDFEVFEIDNVTGHGRTASLQQEFRPFYLAKDTDREGVGYYTTNRVPRTLSERERRFGRKSSYPGTELYLSLVDAAAAPFRSDLRQLEVHALCTNRHLPIRMPRDVGRTDFSLEESAPVSSIRCLSGPTVPVPSFAEGMMSWRLIGHLTPNYLSLINPVKEHGADSLKELFNLYAPPHIKELARQIEGLLSVESKPIIRRVPAPGPITFARGLEITAEFDENAFEGSGVFVLGSILEQFFAKYVSLNSFTETVVRTTQRGEIMRWPAQIGKRPIL